MSSTVQTLRCATCRIDVVPDAEGTAICPTCFDVLAVGGSQGEDEPEASPILAGERKARAIRSEVSSPLEPGSWQAVKAAVDARPARPTSPADAPEPYVSVGPDVRLAHPLMAAIGSSFADDNALKAKGLPLTDGNIALQRFARRLKRLRGRRGAKISAGLGVLFFIGMFIGPTNPGVDRAETAITVLFVFGGIAAFLLWSSEKSFERDMAMADGTIGQWGVNRRQFWNTFLERDARFTDWANGRG